MSVLNFFYTAFAARDAGAMGACYADDARFADPAFGELDAREARAMWAMLLGRSTDLRVTFDVMHADDRSGSCVWHAHYTFTGTGRLVHNIIRSEFVLRDGLITQQRDQFSFWRWSRQALGMPGWLLGWSPWLRNRVRRNARAGLRRYMGS